MALLNSNCESSTKKIVTKGWKSKDELYVLSQIWIWYILGIFLDKIWYFCFEKSWQHWAQQLCFRRRPIECCQIPYCQGKKLAGFRLYKLFSFSGKYYKLHQICVWIQIYFLSGSCFKCHKILIIWWRNPPSGNTVSEYFIQSLMNKLFTFFPPNAICGYPAVNTIPFIKQFICCATTSIFTW